MLLAFLLGRIHRQIHLSGGWEELSVVFTRDGEMRFLHNQLMGQNSSTDVMAVLYSRTPAPEDKGFAELIINTDRAATAWRGHGAHHDAHRELALYLAHGIDHLAGDDDQDTAGRRRMRRRELRWLRAAETCGALRRPLLRARKPRHPCP